MTSYIQHLRALEDTAVTDVMAFMSYNPSIGRVLEKRGVEKFQKLVRPMVGKLPGLLSREDFDSLHAAFIQKTIRHLKTNKGHRLSYGQAQKPLNVFLKVYVDWAGRPNGSTRNRLLKHLHVPLDSILMKAIKREYPDWYRSDVLPLIKESSQEFSLSKIDKRIYSVWQDFFRKECPQKPILFDLAWATER